MFYIVITCPHSISVHGFQLLEDADAYFWYLTDKKRQASEPLEYINGQFIGVYSGNAHIF